MGTSIFLEMRDSNYDHISKDAANIFGFTYNLDETSIMEGRTNLCRPTDVIVLLCLHASVSDSAYHRQPLPGYVHNLYRDV